MVKSKIFKGLVVLTYVAFVLFLYTGYKELAHYSSSLVLPVFTMLYFVKVKNKSLFFALFMVLYSASDLFVFIEDMDWFKQVNYYLGNSLYLLAYVCLLLEVCKLINFSKLFINYSIHFFVLLVLSVYVVYVLQNIVGPYASSGSVYYMELIYNIVLLLLLSLSLLAYFYKDNIKSLYLFIGVLCVVFGEVIWMAYMYVTDRIFLKLISVTLSLVAYYFFYRQSNLLDLSKKDDVNVVS